MGAGGIKGGRRVSKFKPLAEELIKSWSIMIPLSATESKRILTTLALMTKSWFRGLISLDSHVVGCFASQHPDFWLRSLFDVFTDCMLLQCIQSVPPVQAAAAVLKHRFKLRANMIMMDNNLRFITMFRKLTGEFKSPDNIAHDTGHVNRLYHIVDWYCLQSNRRMVYKCRLDLYIRVIACFSDTNSITYCEYYRIY